MPCVLAIECIGQMAIVASATRHQYENLTNTFNITVNNKNWSKVAQMSFETMRAFKDYSSLE